MLASSRVAERLAAFQKGLSSMELVIRVIAFYLNTLSKASSAALVFIALSVYVLAVSAFYPTVCCHGD
jgi:hypothetical protein